MTNIFVKMTLMIMLIFVFCGFQYGGINTAPPFKDSWQTWMVGLALAMSVLILLQEAWSLIKAKKLIC
jgi:hypothetical protein